MQLLQWLSSSIVSNKYAHLICIGRDGVSLKGEEGIVN